MIIASILVLGILGFVFAALLALAADYFRQETDPRLSTILTILPGLNCGACGEAGCRAFAEKLINGQVQVSGCLAGGAEVAEKLAKFMGVDQLEVHKKLATVHCGANEKVRTRQANYSGVETCAAATLIADGGLNCSYACLGYGDCYCACPFDAIRMKEGLPVIDPQKCTACGKCVAACPREIISLRPFENPVVVACSSRDPGAYVRKICPVGCIACKICENLVPEVFKVVDNLSVMDYSKTGVNCDPAIEKCPTRCILKL
ncbi:MAG: RnfABCDGE type electron transport complex subunit B [Candidatus Margulisbacteria bacterium]|nr:RnfABCDGE type electron transport complex subunit B [Candidatus Margulisiibacteriota bacterium]